MNRVQLLFLNECRHYVKNDKTILCCDIFHRNPKDEKDGILRPLDNNLVNCDKLIKD